MDKETEDLLKEVSKKIDTHRNAIAKDAEEALKEIRGVAALSNSTKETVDKIVAENVEKSKKLAVVEEQMRELEQASVRPGGEKEKILSLGEQVIAHADLKAFTASVQGGRRINIPVKNTTTSTGLVPTTAAPVVQPQVQPGVLERLRQRLFVRDLLSPGRTTSPAIFWVQQTGFTNAARVVSEGTAKPYSDITFTSKITPVATLAHMFKASKQILDDFGQLQSLIDLEMRYGLRYAEEQEFLFGDGTGVHLHGLVPQATAYHHEFTVALMTEIDDIRLAILQSQLARIPATGLVMHYTDWAAIELRKDTLGRYIIGDPGRSLTPTLWGLPIATTEITAFVGKFLTGPFQGGAQIFDREDSNVVLSTENADDFEKNLISIRGEERVGLATYRPEGFIYGPFTKPT